MEADLKKVILLHVNHEFSHGQHNSNYKELWIVKRDNRLNTHVTLVDKGGYRNRLRRKKPSDNYVYRPIKGSSSDQGNGWEDDFVASNLTKEQCQELRMGGDSSWSDDEFVEGEKETSIFYSSVKDVQESSASMDIFPIELQEQILALLPFRNILKARSVCKLWNEIVVSKRFQEYISGGVSKKPWYFMSSNPDVPAGFIYNPVSSKWYNFELPFKLKHDGDIASSHGLVCYIDTDYASDLLVCNLMTNRHKKLVLPVGEKNFEYHGLAFSVDPKSSQYTISVVRSMGYDVLINVYSSETLTWNCKKKTLRDWKGRADCVILNGILYLLVLSTTALAGDKYGVFVYDLSPPPPSNDKSEDTIINIPFTITCGRLMNVQDKLVMVGGVGRRGRHGVITGIGIWALEGTEWEEVVRVPIKLLQALGELDDVFASCGGGDTVYIHTYGGTNTLVFDLNSREWKWARFPFNKKFPLQIFTSFCFYPRLDVSAG